LGAFSINLTDIKTEGMFTTYALYSVKFNKHYYGYSSNIEERLLSHNVLGKDWTAKYRPWVIIHTKVFPTKKEAMDYEKWLKSGQGRAFVKKLPHPEK
jgi:putative endonuclease